MQRRTFLSAMGLVPFLPIDALAAPQRKILLIYPGTGLVSRPNEELMAAYRPLEKTIEQLSGEQYLVMITRSISRTDRLSQHADLMFVPPTVAAEAIDDGMVPVVKTKTPAQGYLVARSDWKGKSLKDLSNSDSFIAMTEQGSWLERMTKLVLKQNRVDFTGRDQYLRGGQEDIVACLKRDLVQVGCLRKKAADQIVNTGEGKMLAKLPETPDYTLLASSSMPPESIAKIRNAMLNLPPLVIQALQKGIHAPVEGFEAASSEEYNLIRQAMALPA